MQKNDCSEESVDTIIICLLTPDPWNLLPDFNAEVAELADAQDLKSWGTLKARAGSSPAFGILNNSATSIGNWQHRPSLWK